MGVGKRDILVIDDTPQNLRLLHELLTSSGYTTRSAPSGKMGLKSARLRKPDLILLDVSMPEMDGFQVCRILKQDETLRDVPVLFISAKGESETIVKAFAAGAVDYVTKPFELAEVEARVSTHLRLRDLQEQLERQNHSLEAKVAERTQELREANERLKALDELKREFFTMISHELRTPLNGVIGIADLIVLEREADELTESYHLSRERILRLIDQVSQISELELAGGSEIAASALLAKEAVGLANAASGGPRFVLADETLKKRLKGEEQLIGRAFQTAVEISKRLCGCDGAVPYASSSDSGLRFCFPVESKAISDEVLCSFLSENKTGWQAGPLESMGLEPVVARKLLAIFGGRLFFQVAPTRELVMELAYCDRG